MIMLSLRSLFSPRVPSFSAIAEPFKYFSTKRAGAVFADPTYDNTFKMLCTNKEHPGIIRSILNSFLGFEGNNQIEDIVFSHKGKLGAINGDRAYLDSSVLENTTRYASDSTIDLVCTTQSGKKIAIEMQRAHESYFLTRTQMYMSKLIAGQVAVGQSSKAHEVILDTYIISIGRENIIRDPQILQKQKELLKDKSDLSFSLTVKPIIEDFWVTVEDNKMTWKFFELKKFKEFMKHELIDQHSPLKHQWMKFLLKCQDEEDTPENIPGIIKEGYQIMEMANWTPEQKALYDMEIDQEELTLCKVEKAGVEGKAKGRAEGRAEGRIEGLVEGEAKSIIKALKYNESDEEIIEEHDSLDKKKLSQIKSLSQPPKFDDIRTILQVDEDEFSKPDIDVIGIGLEETPN